jgi:hypothetical protein
MILTFSNLTFGNLLNRLFQAMPEDNISAHMNAGLRDHGQAERGYLMEMMNRNPASIQSEVDIMAMASGYAARS